MKLIAIPSHSLGSVMRTSTLYAVLFAVGGVASNTSAQLELTNWGNLVCSLGLAVDKGGDALGDRHNVICVFVPSDDSPGETYAGMLLAAGTLENLTGQPVVIFAVRATNKAKERTGALEQTFAGSVVGADGAKGPLIGDKNGSVVLNLVSGGEELKRGKPGMTSLELRLVSATG